MLFMKTVTASLPAGPRNQVTRLHAAAGADANSMGQKLKVGGYFALWYSFNIGYNIYNKKVLNMVPNLTWTVGLLQLVLGLLYVFPLWITGFICTITPYFAVVSTLTHFVTGLRAAPQVSFEVRAYAGLEKDLLEFIAHIIVAGCEVAYPCYE